MAYGEVNVGANPKAMEIDSGEKRLNELGYKQELRREMSLFQTFAITFSTMAIFIGTPLYGPTLLYAGPASMIWGYVGVTFFTWFVGFAMAEICSSFPTTGSLYFWAAHLAGPRWGPFASWCCAWLEIIGLIAGIGAQAYSGAQTLQIIILLATGTNKGGGYFAPRSVFLSMYISLTIVWALLNSFALRVIAFLNIISVWWQVLGGFVVVIGLPLIASTTQSASYVFTHFETSPESTGIDSKPYAVIMSVLLSQYCLYGYDTAAHLTEETKGADRTGPMAILCSIGIISTFGWGYFLALTFSIQVYALSRDGGIPFSRFWRKIHPKHKVPINAVWLCAAISIIIGLPILKLNVVFTAIISIGTIGWVGSYAVPIFARLVMDEKNFKPGPFYLGKARRPVCLIAFSYICYTCSIFLLPTLYPLQWDTFNYAPIAMAVSLAMIMLWWALDARKWFKGPVREVVVQNGDF
ncbi:hypothetical protein CJ030_MR3G007489 [Morella rubra]|uniref:Amino-acid permease BAT1 n=1 Tax=Morella rubra TaxID=262757 RepID=A0A6A1W760_9ROSI|nr:hypothetical protein CJ030_MR3G007489 [Morella rubra]